MDSVESDDRLVGHWSSLPLSYGVMEASELGFLGDGWGWSSWFNVGDLCVTRFRWRCPEPGVVELREQWTVEGTPSEAPGSPRFAAAQPARRAGEVTRHRYTFGPAEPYPGAEALPAVHFEEDVEFCSAFARGAAQIRREDDPTYGLLPYP
ncbi:hypothetical protein RCO28_12050 [Streptomyces sp. LHD-70]|uniref:hypothetical protein n=1 Tax=Streptomyces sp. LHD-70 TaxID=3072140 RepID=UPI00280E7E8C|nr:hypothetical protein [Streptomyces sp. LHD-70]MDQ8703214.1 hypothetical protein [Streptomyces sp. LHD-70]